ncbi:MAG TPA: hypothetical protein VMA95_01165 [Streptosporangiaceae bacterium]|nr:hypothetical protein [Streptosporangiaceae bacterium]
MVTATLARIEHADLPWLADVLYISPLEPSDGACAEVVRSAIVASLGRHCCDVLACAAEVAQEAGDHPEIYLPRMRWALRAVARAFPDAAR